MRRDPTMAAVVVPDGVPLFEAAIPISVFGVDRTSTGGPPLRVAVTTADTGSTAQTTAGLVLSGFSGLDVLGTAGVVVVPTWPEPAVEPPDELVAALRGVVDTGGTVMGLCLGAYVLGYAGLLDDRRATTHWHWLDDFARRFPSVHVDDSSLYLDEGPVVTSAGSAAGLDACLHYVRREWGAAAASAIARRMVVAPHRAGNQSQFSEPEPPRVTDSSIAAVQLRALEHLADGVGVDRLASWYGTSRRTFDRDFRSATGQSPLRWLLHQRILRSQRLLETTDLTVDEIAHRVGFSSAVTLRPHFRGILGVSPRHYRDTFTTDPHPAAPTPQ
ncbi:GlxA family transcriptional regulator [Williamsia sterculiae]|uniref:Transcriptional regulator, AraC family with amidase-like domain n=1 Tax=Williamsia sterculiae TaxID=1344003 RepID=A0A1N7D2P2_9NOCA|nr:helix-turn-helix domain-containing protein [Williamsia sterculiae]SIR70111.1 transcriptional regulator, AraC family with amidase-like domain [Williamsia sterculiae]